MSEKREAPLSRFWKKAKGTAPRQKVIASTITTVRRKKPPTDADAQPLLIAEAAKQGVSDLSEKELRVMTDAVTTSAKEAAVQAKDAATQAVSKGASGVRSMWASLQTSSPEWVELPDDVAALNIRSDQSAVAVRIDIDDAGVLQRLITEVSEDRDGTRGVDCWLSLDAAQVPLVHVGKMALGRIPEPAATTIRPLLSRRRAWTPAKVYGSDAAGASVTVELPDRP